MSPRWPFVFRSTGFVLREEPRTTIALTGRHEDSLRVVVTQTYERPLDSLEMRDATLAMNRWQVEFLGATGVPRLRSGRVGWGSPRSASHEWRFEWPSVLASSPDSLYVVAADGTTWSIPLSAGWPGVAERDDDATIDVVATTRRTYDAIGDAYAAANAELPESVVESLDRFVAALPAEARVADVGCGPGRDLTALRGRGLRAVGFDLSAGMLRARGVGGVAVADMTRRLPVPRRSLDGIWCAAAMLHVPRELARTTLACFGEALKVGGVLHLSVAEGHGEAFERDPYLASGDRWFVLHDEAELIGMLTEHSFAVLDVQRSVSRRSWLTVLARQRVSPASTDRS